MERWVGVGVGVGGGWGWAKRGQFTRENSACIIKLIEMSNITFLMRSFKDKSSKTNMWIIIVTNYQSWARNLQFFMIHPLLNF